MTVPRTEPIVPTSRAALLVRTAPAAGATPSPPTPLLYWQPLVGAVVFVLAIVVGATAAVTRSKAPAPLVASLVDDDDLLVILPPRPIEDNRQPILILKAHAKSCLDSEAIATLAKPGPGLEAAAPVVVAIDPEPLLDAKAGGLPKETFGTAVSFERNMIEAADLARAQRKLLFLLHVSGNFEDTEFT